MGEESGGLCKGGKGTFIPMPPGKFPFDLWASATSLTTVSPSEPKGEWQKWAGDI